MSWNNENIISIPVKFLIQTYFEQIVAAMRAPFVKNIKKEITAVGNKA